MKYAKLKELCESMCGEVGDICMYVLDRFDEDDEIDFDTFLECASEEIDSYFTYYDDAWSYLQDNQITDFKEAFYEWNATDVCGIACYYLYEQLSSDVGDYWDYYEEQEDEEEILEEEDDEE